MKKKYNILIAEPSDIIREGLTNIIKNTNRNIQIIQVDTFDNIQKFQNDYKIDIVFINILLLHNDIQAFNKLISSFQETNWLGIISTFYDRDLCKHFHDLVYINENAETINKTISKYLTNTKPSKSIIENSLSKRETDVLKLLVIGKSNKEIAEELFISIHTVVTHRKNISNKLGIKSTAAMAIYAVAKNIIDLNDSLKTII